MTETIEGEPTTTGLRRAGSAGATLIVGFDASPSALAAVDWACRMVDDDGRLVVIGVAPPASGEAQRIGSGLRELTTHPGLLTTNWTPLSRQGWSTAETLLAAAHEQDAEAIIVGAHGHDPSHVFLGSVAHRLLQISDIPVIVVPHARPDGSQR